MPPPPAARPPDARPAPARIAADTRQRTRTDRLARILARSAVEDGAVALTPTLFVQAMLPHRDLLLRGPDGQPVTAPDGRGGTTRLLATHHAATNGAFTLSVRAGLVRGPSPATPYVSRGIPYGGLARLLLAHLVTEARRRDAPTLPLGPTLSAFCHRLDITPSGGPHGRLRYVVDQLVRLATCVVSFEWETAGPGRRDLRGEHLLVVDDYHLWHHLAPTARPGAASAGTASAGTANHVLRCGGTLRLSERFWTDVAADCFPLDLRKAQLFRAHPTAYDLYLWLTYRLGRLERQHQPRVTLSYDALHRQLGSHYATDAAGRLTPDGKKNFARHLRHALALVRHAWPDLDVETPRGRLVLHATTGPDVAHRPPRPRPA